MFQKNEVSNAEPFVGAQRLLGVGFVCKKANTTKKEYGLYRFVKDVKEELVP
jgi:hypothetical protein